jgi:hypothetical protein
MTDRRKHALTIIGVLLTLAGFYLRNAPSFPSLQRVVAPSYARAQRALKEFGANGSLRTGQPGFDVLAAIFEDMIAAQNPRIPRDAIVLERIQAIGGGIEFGATVTRPVVRANFYFEGQSQPTVGNMLDVQPQVDVMWETRSLWLSSILLWSGILVSLTPVSLAVLEARRKKVQTTAPAPPAESPAPPAPPAA